MGSDLRVVNAARISHHKEHKRFEGNDEGLINYLASHNHWSPFGHCVVTVRERVPLFVARQRFKHFIGNVYTEQGDDGLEQHYNEVSRRYVDESPEFYIPEFWRKRSPQVKQGSSDEPVNSLRDCDKEWKDMGIEDAYERYLDFSASLYTSLLTNDVAPEQARMVLPQSMYTEYYVTGSLAGFARAFNLRSDPHAQKEIRDLAALWNEIITPLFPVSWRALTSAR